MSTKKMQKLSCFGKDCLHLARELADSMDNKSLVPSAARGIEARLVE